MKNKPMKSYIDTVRSEAQKIAVKATEYIRQTTPMGVDEREELQNEIIADIESLLKSSLEHFAQVVEEEVLEGYDLESWEEWYKGTKKYGGTPEEYIKLIEIQQKAKLAALLAPTKGEE